MDYKKLKLLTIVWIVVSLGIDVFGVFYVVRSMKPLAQERDLAISAGATKYLNTLESQKNKERNIVIVSGVIFGLGTLIFFQGFSMLAPYLRKEWNSYNFKCKKCGYLFKPDFLNFNSLFSANGVFYTVVYAVFKPPFFIKCLGCSKRSLCKLEKTEQIDS